MKRLRLLAAGLLGATGRAVGQVAIVAHHLVADLLVALIALHLADVAWHRCAGRPALWRRMW